MIVTSRMNQRVSLSDIYEHIEERYEERNVEKSQIANLLKDYTKGIIEDCVRVSRWIEFTDGTFCCEKCCAIKKKKTKYCPDCGAEIVGERKEIANE